MVTNYDGKFKILKYQLTYASEAHFDARGHAEVVDVGGWMLVDVGWMCCGRGSVV